jgi:peroxiredoxin Q/BCP
MAELDRGKTVPDFDLPRAGGGTLGLLDLKGKPFVLFFFPKAGSEGCTKEAVEFSALKMEFEALGVSVVGVSPDEPETMARFSTKGGLTVHLLSDQNRSLIDTCGLWIEKNLYGHKHMGVARTTFLVGDDGKVVQVWRNIKIAGHAAAVLEAARAL